jgi:nucleoside-triphosphatase THEP1
MLARVATRLMAEGMPVAGAVQHNIACDRQHCDMDLQVLPEGPVVRISQNLGAESQGCRLDAGALETAVVAVAARMGGARLLIVNKFGKHEAEGRGFRDLVAEAAGQGIPVLIGINDQNKAAFAAFAGDLAEPVAATEEAVLAWVAQAVTEEV